MITRFLRASWRKRFQSVKEQFNRALPHGDYIVDRWEKARRLGFGNNSSVYDSCLVLGDVKVGAEVWVGPYTILDGSGGLTIGDWTTISAGCHIYSHDSVQRCLTGGKAAIEHAAVSIGSQTYIGPNTVIAKGVNIGSGCLIGANSFVTEDVPDNMMVAGTPARTIRKLGPSPIEA